jgi:CheY-like chemotaxis protein
MNRCAPSILVVDDNEGHALLMAEHIKASGVAPERMNHLWNGQELLDFFFGQNARSVTQGEGAYIVLLDIRMPKVDGIEALRRLKMDDEFKKLLIIMLTTSDDEREVVRCYELGCAGYVVKPVESGLFAESMRLLGQHLQLVEVAAVTPR